MRDGAGHPADCYSQMNAREGMRRLGLVVGIIGAAVGFVLCWAFGSDPLSRRSEHHVFKALFALPAVQAELNTIKAGKGRPRPAHERIPRAFKTDGTPIYLSDTDALADSSVACSIDTVGSKRFHFE